MRARLLHSANFWKLGWFLRTPFISKEESQHYNNLTKNLICFLQTFIIHTPLRPISSRLTTPAIWSKQFNCRLQPINSWGWMNNWSKGLHSSQPSRTRWRISTKPFLRGWPRKLRRNVLYIYRLLKSMKRSLSPEKPKGAQ